MKAVLDGSYRKKGTGNLVFRYIVKTETADEAAVYKAQAGDNYRENEKGEAFWFSTKFVGNTVDLAFNQAGEVFANTSEVDSIVNLANQYTGNVGIALAGKAADMILANALKGSSGSLGKVVASQPQQIATPEVKTVSEVDEKF